MIYPTQRMVLMAAAVAPAALLIGLAAPAFWISGLALIVLLLGLGAVDALAGQRVKPLVLHWRSPGAVAVGEAFHITVDLSERIAAEVAAELDGPVEATGAIKVKVAPGETARLSFSAARRGTAVLTGLWVRLRGPLGLVWKQKREPVDHAILLTPDLRPTRDKGPQILAREAMHGIIARKEIGEGAEFDALADYRQGMDRRAIDWKQSARHTRLIAKEYQVERNNNIVVALDCGRTMSEPVDGVPRVDRAISAALLAAFVALKQGDRVGLFAFDSKPRAYSKAVSGPAAFALLQQAAAAIDYAPAEANYTLALATLASSLKRRSLVIVFTEFSDTVSAELMLAALGPLLGKHLLLFLVLRDEELERFTNAEPVEADDVSRAVTAAAMLRERRLVLTRLRHLGIEVVEANAAEAGPALVAAYLDLKRRGRL